MRSPSSPTCAESESRLDRISGGASNAIRARPPTCYHRRMKTLLLAVALAACGGKSKPSESETTNLGSARDPANLGSAAPIATDKPAAPSDKGGVIEMEGNDATSMADARKRMAAQCGEGKYTITQEGAERAGPKESVWRIHYQCQ